MDNPVGLSDNKMKAIALALAEQEKSLIQLLDTKVKSVLDKLDSLEIPKDLTAEVKELQTQLQSTTKSFNKFKEYKPLDGNDGLDADQEALEKSAIAYIDSLKLKSGYDGGNRIDADQEAIEKKAIDFIKSLELTSGYDGQDGSAGRDGLGLDSAVWSDEGVYRKGSYVVHNMGQTFEAVEDTAKEPSVSKTWKRIGSGGFRMTGGFKKEFDYKSGDFYIKDFSLWLYQGEKHSLLVPRPKAIKGDAGQNYDAAKDIKAMQDRHDEAMELQKLEHEVEMTKLWDAMNKLMVEIKL